MPDPSTMTRGGLFTTGKTQEPVPLAGVTIDAELHGNWGLSIRWNDGHDTGIYSWDYLYDLGEKQETNWKSYLARLHALDIDTADLPALPRRDDPTPNTMRYLPDGPRGERVRAAHAAHGPAEEKEGAR